MIQVSAGQTLLDVCLQELGTLSALFALADANGLSITSPLSPGQLLQVPATVLSMPEVASYFSQRLQRINVADTILPGTVAPLEPAAVQHYFSSDFFTPQYFA
jgi:hypothetical protein